MKPILNLSRIPLTAKVAFSAFMAVMVPFYLSHYGPTNFLYFCDVALFITLIGMWMESALLISMCAVGILLPQALWLADFGGNLFGMHFTGMTDYMFDSNRPLFTRGLSLFHGWFPILLVWLLRRVGYDRRAFVAWSLVGLALITICYLWMPAAGAQLADPAIPVNINYVYGMSDTAPQHWIKPNYYVILWSAALVTLAYFPTHIVLRKVFYSPSPKSDIVQAPSLTTSVTAPAA